MTAQSPLAFATQQEVVAGSTIAYQDEHSVILHRGKPVRHVMHLILSFVVPFYFWVWVVIGLTGGAHQISLTESGGIVARSDVRTGLPVWVKVLWGLLALAGAFVILVIAFPEIFVPALR